MTAHLLVAVSSHGFGHVAQVAPVANALRQRVPKLRLTLRTAAPSALLASRFDGPFALQPIADDFGMCQDSALDVDVPRSAAAYREFHTDWERRVDAAAEALAVSAPDLILGDVPYLTLAAAARAGIPAVALSSLNWFHIYRHYCGQLPEAGPILEQMLAAYASARWFLRTRPAMPMDGFANTREVGTVAQVGVNRRPDLDERFGTSGEKLVLIAFGGIATRLPLEQWPVLQGIRWLVPQEWAVRRADVLSIESLGLAFSDVLASCDLLLTKPGYGAFTEAAGAGVPVLYVRRGDWPEEPCLVDWLNAHGRCAEVSRLQTQRGDFAPRLLALLEGGRHAPAATEGAREVARLLAPLLGPPIAD